MFHKLCRIFALATATACLMATLASAASAAVTILYVSTTGSNSNPCTLAQPCRSLQKAVNTAPDGGEVHVLDSGFYGNNANIRKSITIIGNGHTVSLGKPISVDAAGARVTLRRLVLNGERSTTRAMSIVAVRTLHIEHCVVHSFTGDAIFMNTSNADVFVTDSIFRGNGFAGLLLFGGGQVHLTIDNSRIEQNGGVGLFAIDIESTVTRTVISRNASGGVAMQGGTMNVTSSTSADNGLHGYQLNIGAEMTLESSVARGNGSAGLNAFNGTAIVSNSSITYNTTGILKGAGGTVLTRENNTVAGNTTNVDGALTPLGGT